MQTNNSKYIMSFNGSFKLSALRKVQVMQFSLDSEFSIFNVQGMYFSSNNVIRTFNYV